MPKHMLIDESGGEDGTSDKPAKTLLAFAIGTDIVVITLSVLLIVTQCLIIINDNGEICTSRPLYPKAKGDKSFRFSDSSFSAIGEINASMYCHCTLKAIKVFDFQIQALHPFPWLGSVSSLASQMLFCGSKSLDRRKTRNYIIHHFFQSGPTSFDRILPASMPARC